MCFKPIKVAPKNISMMIRLLEAVLTKSNAGEGVVDKNKLLQWLEQPCLTATKTFNCVMCWRRLPMSQSL
jgi:hypothetical protein